MSSPIRRRPGVSRVAIIGGGPGGLCMAIRLKQGGCGDFVVLEKAEGVGGTWWHNTYPGAACDIESHLYCFSFEPKWDWPRPYANQSEIRAYLEHCVEKYELGGHLLLGQEVRSAHWDEEHGYWSLQTRGGEHIRAESVVSAVGMFNEIHVPEIPGLEEFAGTRFHSARWNDAHDLSGERVAVVGSAASAVQFVPEIGKLAKRVDLYQRSANWVLPKEDTPFTEAELAHFREDPAAHPQRRRQVWDQVDAIITFSKPEALRKAEALGLEAIAAVEDPTLRAQLTPTHPYGCKRPLIANHYYPAFNRGNIDLICDPIERVTRDAVITREGTAREADTLILATGFETTRYLSCIDVRGRGGHRLAKAWEDGAQAYLGITTPGFPNLFMLYGPNTNNGSILFMLECQVDYVLQLMERLRREQLAWVDVRPEVAERYNEQIQLDIANVEVWGSACNGYYRSPSGRVVTQWPFTMEEYRARTLQPDPAAFITHPTRPGEPG